VIADPKRLDEADDTVAVGRCAVLAIGGATRVGDAIVLRQENDADGYLKSRWAQRVLDQRHVVMSVGGDLVRVRLGTAMPQQRLPGSAL
jgi:hypothetical protein